jgi:hypothetical protein
MIPHEGFITNVFALLNGGSSTVHGVDMSLKVIKIVKKLLNKSKYAKIIENVASIEEALPQIPAKEYKFLELVTLYLHNNRERFRQCQNAQVDDDDDEQFAYARKYSQLLSVLCSNFDILLIGNGQSEIANVLFALLFDATRAGNLVISQEILEFWTGFLVSLKNSFQDNQLAEVKYQYLLAPFVEVVKIVLVQCQRSKVSVEQLPELEEIEATTRGMSVAKYREHSAEVILKAYLILKRNLGD